jgi:transposase
MSTSIEAKIVELHLRHLIQEEIAAPLRTGRNRISRCLRKFHYSGAIPDSHRIGRPSNHGGELVVFVETRVLRTPSLSQVDLTREVSEHLGQAISRSTVNAIRHRIQFKDQPPGHTQALTGSQTADRVAFC